jgi:tricorn protease
MSGIDWQAVYQRYLPLLQRVASRSEFSDLMWEMQGELGTSHAYEIGGDYRPEPRYDQGLLGADLEYDADTQSWRVAHIVQGDVWDEEKSSPLIRPGINVRVGDRLVAVGGRAVDADRSPAELLVNQADNEVLLTFVGEDNAPRTVTVKALCDERPARYREWVETNRRRVHQATDGRVGYIHIPDMGPQGYAEFHRSYLLEVGRQGLIVDVRFNSGGQVSGLLLEKLARRRLGYDVQRWGEPTPYPEQSPAGPMVALTNEWSGSDGDIFSHTFKLMDLGPLIGTRTWGGVIGISGRDGLVDGGLTTQPEFSLWFKDVGWQVENYGTDPDIEVEIPPQDYVAGRDPQLARAIEEIERLLAQSPPEPPAFDERPRLSLPTLPDVPHGGQR